MTREFKVRLRAESDIRSASDWYEGQRPGLGQEFLDEVQKRLEEIRKYPDACPVLYRDVRRAALARFPYVVFYVSRPQRIAVLAVMHQYRDPGTWPLAQPKAH